MTAAVAWLKISDPDQPLPRYPDGTDLRVLLPADEQFTQLADKLVGLGAQVRRVRYLLEDEAITGPPGDRFHRRLRAGGRTSWLVPPYRTSLIEVTDEKARAARDAFNVMWLDHAGSVTPAVRLKPAAAVVPAALASFLPFSTLNPAQVEALPEIFGHEQNLVVVAPTGSGKTVIGMGAVLRTVTQRRKAAWLVPQRSLTDELDRELAGWRGQGLRVERLSGEHKVDIDRIQEADLWVSTTEKFEAICRASAFQQALAEVGAVVVDEIHMLGDQTRGPILEALLARVRDSQSPARIIGLSATVANAEQIADWLEARLVRVGWRPSRLTWQLPTIPRHSDYAVTEATRTRLAVAITELVTADGGSVLVFCGSKRNVRRTALIIAAKRGVDVSGVRLDNSERLQEVCRQARVGLHYQGWEYRQDAEQAFRQRELDVLVATSTVAAGVNLPARAVVIQDTQIGLNTVDVATVQQMFGRAGRIGAGEDTGWAFLIVEDHERANWQSRLVAGHTVQSQIQSSLPEQVLSEVVQQRVSSDRQAEQWWVRTLAYRQGRHDLRPLQRAIGFLVGAEMLTRAPGDASERRLAATNLGKLTARLMVSPPVCDSLRQALGDALVPTDPASAERLLITTLSAHVPKLAQASASDDVRAAVDRLLASGGHLAPVDKPPRNDSAIGARPGDLAAATLLAVSSAATACHPGVRQISGIPYSAMYPILEEAPRYLHWLATQGLFGTVHPWCAIVAADLGRRIRWRNLQPPRGAGRLLWMCEQMATPVHLDQAVPTLWAGARAREYRSPDWTAAGRPNHCQLDRAGYLALLRDRATGAVIEVRDGQVHASGPPGSVLAVWAGASYEVTPVRNGAAVVATVGAGEPGAALFTWRGDYRANGWLTAYTAIST